MLFWQNKPTYRKSLDDVKQTFRINEMMYWGIESAAGFPNNVVYMAKDCSIENSDSGSQLKLIENGCPVTEITNFLGKLSNISPTSAGIKTRMLKH